MGLNQDYVVIEDTALEFLITTYTAEAGVRKLKDLLFDIYGSININMLKRSDTVPAGKQSDLSPTGKRSDLSPTGKRSDLSPTGKRSDLSPTGKRSDLSPTGKHLNITIELIRDVYLRNRNPIIPLMVPIDIKESVGLIHGLWANQLGCGGILPIQCVWKPNADAFSLSLTGTQGDVMKESMNVALTLAYNLFKRSDPSVKQSEPSVKQSEPSVKCIDPSVKCSDPSVKCSEENTGSKGKGIHIHCPDTSTPKDGPSAGAAITCAIYSLLSNRPIRTDIAMTGEICLNGQITQIGGLELKILGGLQANIKEFLFPRENMKDFNTFIEKYPEYKDAAKYIPVSSIKEVFTQLQLA
jgi:ATP-dependent Lon protease